MGRRAGQSQGLTPLELKIMQVLWREGPANVQQVQAALAGEAEFAYTTVQTMLNVLARKGRVKRRMQGRAFEYRAAATKEAVLKQALHELVERLFGGSSEELVMSLVKTRQLDAARLTELGRRLAREKKEGERE